MKVLRICSRENNLLQIDLPDASTKLSTKRKPMNQRKQTNGGDETSLIVVSLSLKELEHILAFFSILNILLYVHIAKLFVSIATSFVIFHPSNLYRNFYYLILWKYQYRNSDY